MKDYREKEKLMYKFLSKIYDAMDVIIFPTRKCNPRLALGNRLSDGNLLILDVCCGTANTSIAIAKKNNNSKIVGIDLSPDMLKVARNKISRKKLTNIELMGMDATNIKINKQFDVVSISLSLHEMPHDVMDSVISQIASKLKPDGKLYIIDWSKPKHFLRKALFMFFPYFFEQLGQREFRCFLKIDWNSYLSKYGLKVESAEQFSFTSLITISR